MTKTVEFAIYWLPMVASILLGGVASAAWYGGDRIPAIWLAFVGLVFLLLTCALQLQQYVYAKILQPSFQVLAPAEASMIRWDPAINGGLINVRWESEGALPPDRWRTPLFPLKNSSSVNAQDVTVKWEAQRYDVASVVAHSAPLVAVGARLDGARLVMANGVNDFEATSEIKVPIITRSTEVFIPLPVFAMAEIYFVATMIDRPPGWTSEPFIFDLTITWASPENADPERFRFKAVATDARLGGAQSPAFRARVTFSIEKLANS